MDARPTPSRHEELRGRVAVVTGATGSIGRVICRVLAERGATIAALWGTREDAATELIAALPGSGHVTAGIDLADRSSIEAALADVRERAGSVSVLVHAAHPGTGSPRPVADLDPAVLATQLVTVDAYAALCAAVLPGMRGQGWGRVVLVSGALMTRPAPGFGAYGAAKAAAATLTRYLALEEGRNGVTANIVAPGRVVPDVGEESPDPERAELARQLLARTALGRFPTHGQVADAVRVLVESEYLTGQTLWVTGGEPIA